MKKNLLIVGAGGHGRCCLDIARETELYEEIAFLDDGCIGESVNGAQVLDCIANIEHFQKAYHDVFVAVGNGKLREELIRVAENHGFKLATLISKKSVVSSYSYVEKGTVVFPLAVVEANAELGKGSIVAANATINHDARLEAYSLVNSNSVIRPNAIVKKYAMVGSHCVISFGNIVEQEEKVPDGTVR